MDELAKKLLNDHKNPIVKVDLPGTKLLLAPSTSEEVKLEEESQKNLETLFRYERTERRCARSQAEWSADNKLAKVTKVVKTLLNNFAFQDKNGIFLYPEETLFLMETNRLEVSNNNIPLSIQEGYDLLRHHECALTRYRVYKKLALLGYRVVRYEEILRRRKKDKRKEITNMQQKSNMSKKRNTEDCSEFENVVKRVRTEVHSVGNNEDLNKSEVKEESKSSDVEDIRMKYINDIFEKLRKTAPKEYKPIIDNNEIPDYCIFLPTNKSKCEYDFNLFICEKPILERKNYNLSMPTVFAICSEDNIAFYKFSNVTLPFLQ